MPATSNFASKFYEELQDLRLKPLEKGRYSNRVYL